MKRNEKRIKKFLIEKGFNDLCDAKESTFENITQKLDIDNVMNKYENNLNTQKPECRKKRIVCLGMCSVLLVLFIPVITFLFSPSENPKKIEEIFKDYNVVTKKEYIEELITSDFISDGTKVKLSFEDQINNVILKKVIYMK